MTNEELISKGYQLFKIDEHIHPTKSGTYDVFVNQYWFVTKDRHVLRYKNMSFQTNRDIRVLENLHNIYPNCTIEKIPFIYF